MFRLGVVTVILSGCQIASMTTTTTESPENQQCPANCTEGNANTLSSLEASASACYIVCSEMKFQCPNSKTLIDLQVYQNQSSSDGTACDELPDRSQNMSQQCQVLNNNVCTIVICDEQICSTEACVLIVHTCKPTDNSSSTTAGNTTTTMMITSETQSITLPVTSPKSTQSTEATTTTTTITTTEATTSTTSPTMTTASTTTSQTTPTASTTTAASTQPPPAVTMTTTAARSSSSTTASTDGVDEKRTDGVASPDVAVIIGVAVGGVVVMVIVMAIAVCVYIRYRRRKNGNRKFVDSLRVTYKPKGATTTGHGRNLAAPVVFDEPNNVDSAQGDNEGGNYSRVDFNGETFAVDSVNHMLRNINGPPSTKQATEYLTSDVPTTRTSITPDNTYVNAISEASPYQNVPDVQEGPISSDYQTLNPLRPDPAYSVLRPVSSGNQGQPASDATGHYQNYLFK